MVAEIDAARKAGDTLGGVIEVIVHGLPVGLGSHRHRRLSHRRSDCGCSDEYPSN